MSAPGALAAVGVVAVMLVGLELLDRFDAWARSNGFGWLMIGSREYAVAMKWFFRVLLVAFAVVCMVLFFVDR